MNKKLLALAATACGAVAVVTAIGLHANGYKLAFAEPEATVHTITFNAEDIVSASEISGGYCDSVVLRHKVDTSDDTLALDVSFYGSIEEGDSVNENGHILTLQDPQYPEYAYGYFLLSFELFEGVSEVQGVHLNGDFNGTHMDHWSQIEIEDSFPDQMPEFYDEPNNWQASIYLDDFSQVTLDSIEIIYSC